MNRPLTMLSLLLIALTARAAPEQVTAAEDAAAAFATHAGTPQAIQENLTQPLLSSSLMRTPDGKEFAAQLICPAQDSFLEILITPSATGDIAAINIQQDTSMDGVFDRRYSPPFAVSGVCANGLIACTAGSWSDCRHYAWVADQSNSLDVNETGLNQLGGCFCINNHCGSGLLANNLDSVVAAVGGGAANALARQNPYYAVTKVEVDGPLAHYFGQNTADCGAAGPATLTAYFANAGTLSNDAAAAAAAEDVYQLMTDSPAATQSNLTTVSCDIRRSVAMDETGLNDIIDYDGGSGSISPCGSDCLQLVLGRIGDNYWGPSNCAIFEHNVRFNVLRPQRVLKATLIRAVWDDWIQVRANADLIWSGPNPWSGFGNPPGRCELKTSWDRALNVDFTRSLQVQGPADFNIRVAVAGHGEGYAYARVTVDTACYLQDDLILDGCRAYQADTDCSLQSETVDGVDIVRNFAATGLSPLPSTVTINGSACSENVSRDWWHKHRVYQCRAAGDYDFSAALERKAFVHASATPTGYQDRVTDIVTTGDLPLLDEVAVPACVAACKTRRPRIRNDVGRSGVVSDENTSPDTYDILYHECSQDLICPLSEGEELIKACSCLDEFPEASVVMQLIRMAGQDILCSSGTPQAL